MTAQNETRPLYVVLGIETDATPEEVKRAYYRQALRYHPDKAGPQSAEKFQEVLAAYTLLSDPDAREVYDRYGEQGLTNMDLMPAMAEVTHMMSVVMFFRVTFGILSILCAFGFIFFLLVIINIDKQKNWNWMMIAWPAFAAGAVIFLAVLGSMVLRIKKYVMWYRMAKNPARTEDSSSTSSDHPPCGCRGTGPCGLHSNGCPPAAATEGSCNPPCKQACQLNKHLFVHEATFWVRHIAIICFLITFAMLCDKIEQEITKKRERPYNWWCTFGPCILASFLSVAYIGQFRHALILRGVHEICSYMLAILNVLSFIMFCCRVAQAIFIPLRLEGIVQWRPMIVALPSIIMFAARYTKLVCLEISRVRGLNKFAERQRNPNARSGCSRVRISDVGPDENVKSSSEEDHYAEVVDEKHSPKEKICSDENEDVVREEEPECGSPCSAPKNGYTQPSFIIQVAIETITHVLILLSIILCVGKTEGWNISMAAALAPALIMFGFLFVVFAVLYSCFTIYVRTVKQEERQKRKREERERAAEARRQREDRRQARQAANFVPAPIFEDKNGIRSHYHGRGGARQGAFYWGYTADAPPPVFPHFNSTAQRLAEEADDEYVRTPFTPRNDFQHYVQQADVQHQAIDVQAARPVEMNQMYHQQQHPQNHQQPYTHQKPNENFSEQERHAFENGGYQRAHNNTHKNNLQGAPEDNEYVEATFTASVSPLTPPNRFYNENPRAGFHSRIPIDCPEANENNF